LVLSQVHTLPCHRQPNSSNPGLTTNESPSVPPLHATGSFNMSQMPMLHLTMFPLPMYFGLLRHGGRQNRTHGTRKNIVPKLHVLGKQHGAKHNWHPLTILAGKSEKRAAATHARSVLAPPKRTSRQNLQRLHPVSHHPASESPGRYRYSPAARSR
jgi:hypothetical protein